MNDKDPLTSITLFIADKYMTRESIMSFITSLSRLQESLYDTATNFEDLLPKFAFNISSVLIDIINELNIRKGSTESANKLNELKRRLLDIPVFNLKLNFYPDTEYLSLLYAWVKKNVTTCVLNVEVLPDTLGGVIIDFSGRYIDKSLDTLVDTYLISNKPYVEELLR